MSNYQNNCWKKHQLGILVRMGHILKQETSFSNIEIFSNWKENYHIISSVLIKFHSKISKDKMLNKIIHGKGSMCKATHLNGKIC